MKVNKVYLEASFVSFIIHGIIILYLLGFFYFESQQRSVLSKPINVNLLFEQPSKKIDNKSQVQKIETNITEFSLGVSVGGKWVTKSGFVAEIFGGIGRNILNNSDDSYDPIEVAGRVGISIGKRF